MAMTEGEKKAYARAYSRGARWPEHKPPAPPERVIAGLMEALTNLRDECDSVLATFDKDDPLEKQLGPKIKDADEAMAAVTRWLFLQDG